MSMLQLRDLFNSFFSPFLLTITGFFTPVTPTRVSLNSESVFPYCTSHFRFMPASYNSSDLKYIRLPSIG